MIYAYRLLKEKRKELSDAANKLKNGLGKIDETREKVECTFYFDMHFIRISP